jgi:signal transduction histidine kinase
MNVEQDIVYINQTPIRTMSIKILMLEDFVEDADLIERQLTRDKMRFISHRVDTRDEFTNAVKQFRPDVILSDHSLPQFNSLAALKIAKEEMPNVPFILVTGSVSEEFAVSCMKAGADDYILKNNLSRLPAAIETSIQKRKLEEENIIIKRLNAEIEKKNNELDYLNQEKDRFMGIVSHDLQNYVATMGHIVDSIKTSVSGFNNKRDSQINRLDRTVVHMRTLISDFLTVNRIQSGIINPLYNLVNVGNLVQDIVDRYEDAASRKNIKVTYSNKCKDSFFRTDVSYFSIITDNLVSNAIKYTNSGKSIKIEITKKDKKYILKVKDEGQGIPKEDIQKMYGRFQKLSPKPTNNEPSNGLGLSIVKDLVAALKGTIDCKSEVGKGTMFTVTF